MIIQNKNALAVCVGLSLAAGAAQIASAAISIPLVNSGFETDTVGPNDGVAVVANGWSMLGLGNGNAYVGNGSWVTIPGAHGGSQYFLAHTNGGARALRQDTTLLWSELSVGDTLTISAWTTYRSDLSGDVATHFWLNDSDTSGLYSNAFNPTDAPAGVWTQRTWTHTVTQANLTAAATNSWGAVEVQIGILGAAGDRQVVFDDISLTYEAIPEPTGISLCAVGIGLALLRRKRI